MPRTPLVLIAPAAFAVAAGAPGARGAMPNRVCTIPSHKPNSFAVQLDTTRRAVFQNGIPLADGSRSAGLPGLGYFVTSETDGTMAWGARNIRTGTTHYRYEFDAATGRLSYDAEALHAEGTCAPVTQL